MFVFRRITNNKDKKSATFYSNFLLLQAHCPKNLAKSSWAIFQFSRLMQYFTLGGTSPMTGNKANACRPILQRQPYALFAHKKCQSGF